MVLLQPERSRALDDTAVHQEKGTATMVRGNGIPGDHLTIIHVDPAQVLRAVGAMPVQSGELVRCLLYTSDAADERSSVDLGGSRIIKKKHA